MDEEELRVFGEGRRWCNLGEVEKMLGEFVERGKFRGSAPLLLGFPQFNPRNPNISTWTTARLPCARIECAAGSRTCAASGRVQYGRVLLG